VGNEFLVSFGPEKEHQEGKRFLFCMENAHKPLLLNQAVPILFAMLVKNVVFV